MTCDRPAKRQHHSFVKASTASIHSPPQPHINCSARDKEQSFVQSTAPRQNSTMMNGFVRHVLVALCIIADVQSFLYNPIVHPNLKNIANAQLGKILQIRLDIGKVLSSSFSTVSQRPCLYLEQVDQLRRFRVVPSPLRSSRRDL
jgi:hypothetical protein